MTQTFVSLEKVIRRAPLGVRFVDLVRNTPVEDGLDVQVWSVGYPDSALIAERSPVSGIYGARSLPGLRDYETGTAARSVQKLIRGRNLTLRSLAIVVTDDTSEHISTANWTVNGY